MQLKAKAETTATLSAQMKEELQEHSQSTEEGWASPTLPVTWEIQANLTAFAWRKSALQLFHQLLRGGGAIAGTGAIENSWESAKSQQAQDVDGQQLNSFTEMT